MFNLRSPRYIIILLILVVSFGSLLRLTNLNQKPYWLDETYTLLRASSYTAQAATAALFDGHVLSVADVLRYQQPSAHDQGALGTITGLATEEPQLPPLYFLLTRVWAQHFGTAPFAVRSLPAMASLFTFPVIYWLSLELFASPLAGWLAMALVAVSPINLRYADEARPYSLWLLLMVLACAAILRAIRQPTKRNWGLYAGVIALGFYCHLLTGLVVLAHGLYILAVGRWRGTKTVLTYVVSAFAAITVAVPWFWLAWQNRAIAAQTTEHTTHPFPFSRLAQFWSLSLDRLFVAWHFNANPICIYLTLPVVLLVSYSGYFICRQTSWRIWGFLFLLLGTAVLPFVIPDLIWGGRRSTYERYFLIGYISLDLIVAYLLAVKLMQPLQSNVQRYFWRLLTVGLLSGGLLSCLLGVLAPTWWGWSEFDVAIARMTNAVPQPLIIADAPFGGIVPFCHQVKASTKFILLKEPHSLDIPDTFSHVFLYNPSERLLALNQPQTPTLIYKFTDPMTELVVSLYQLSPTPH